MNWAALSILITINIIAMLWTPFLSLPPFSKQHYIDIFRGVPKPELLSNWAFLTQFLQTCIISPGIWLFALLLVFVFLKPKPIRDDAMESPCFLLQPIRITQWKEHGWWAHLGEIGNLSSTVKQGLELPSFLTRSVSFVSKSRVIIPTSSHRAAQLGKYRVAASCRQGFSEFLLGIFPLAKIEFYLSAPASTSLKNRWADIHQIWRVLWHNPT